MIDSNIPLIYTHDDFVEGIKTIVKAVKASNFKPDYIVGIARGGAIPAVYLSHALKLPLRIVEWSSTHDNALGDRVSDAIIAEDIADGLRVLVVDDIVDGGDTIRELLNDWGTDSLYTESNPQGKVAITAMFYNPSQETPVAFYDRIIDRAQDPRWVIFDWEAI